MARLYAILVWIVLLVCLAVPMVVAAQSPLLAWRDPIYILAGFAGVAALGPLLLQPLLIAGVLPGLRGRQGREVHRFVGIGFLAAVLVHVIGLWITSPPDVVDALLFVSPTPFSAWGVIAMWAALASGLLAVTWRRLRIRPRIWRRAHLSLAVLIISGTVVHALLIEGTMESVTKAALCFLIVAATGKLLVDFRTRSRASRQ